MSEQDYEYLDAPDFTCASCGDGVSALDAFMSEKFAGSFMCVSCCGGAWPFYDEPEYNEWCAQHGVVP